MKKWNERKKEAPLLHICLFAYWLVLLIWQNIGGGENRSGVDLIIKCGLMLMLFVYYFNHMTGIRRDVLKIILILVMNYGTVKMSNGIALSEALYYFFPLLFILSIYGVGGHFEITRKQLLTLCNLLIAVVTYTALYALIFCFDQFANAFSVDSAYGNELKSFLFSSHEYGLYLAFGIMAAILCLEITPNITPKLKLLYYSAIVLFLPNLILTFSRTSILAFLIMFLCYTIAFAKRRMRAIMLWSIVLAVLIVLIIPSLRDFFWEIVMKENNDAGREDLIDRAMKIFNSGTMLEKLLGRDFYYVEQFLQSNNGFSSFHNAYVSQLVSNGYLGVGIIIVMSFLSFHDIYLTIKSGAEHAHLAKLFFGFALAAIVFMLFNTTVLYASSIDSYFLTLFAAIVPKYVNRSICKGTFEKEVKVKGYGKTKL